MIIWEETMPLCRPNRVLTIMNRKGPNSGVKHAGKLKLSINFLSITKWKISSRNSHPFLSKDYKWVHYRFSPFFLRIGISINFPGQSPYWNLSSPFSPPPSPFLSPQRLDGCRLQFPPLVPCNSVNMALYTIVGSLEYKFLLQND
jgi:hypothetical protein